MKLGLIGLSDGNGHPYSWAAICNGYDKVEMQKCGFEAIPDYLEKEKFPQAQISDARVTHIWTQSYDLSCSVAKASYIPNICNDLSEMIGEVDAVLLARDDSENHLKYAQPFLKAGIPIYIDKPFALTRKDSEILMGLEIWEGQIFTCSALYFADELKCSLDELKQQVGMLQNVIARTPKSWGKYAVHVVEPIIQMIGHKFQLVDCNRLINNKSTHVSFSTDTGLTVQLLATGLANTGIILEYIGDKGTVSKMFRDAFPAFKSALESFIKQVRTKEIQIPRDHTRKVVEVLELGIRN